MLLLLLVCPSFEKLNLMKYGPVTCRKCFTGGCAGASLVIGAPLVVQNALPMPVQVLLRPDGYRNAGPTR